MPAVPIILPTITRMQFLSPAIDSVFAQTFPKRELTIADDGSNVGARTWPSVAS